MSFIEVARTDEIPAGTMKSFSVSGTTVIISNIGGKFHAVASKCTHRGGDLGKGKMEGSVVICPRHGSQFDLTNGLRIQGPAVNNLTVYPVRTEGQSVQVEI
jgi:3-phenylpropionate/trans-cinnamate dioxygenase ferredoxin component